MKQLVLDLALPEPAPFTDFVAGDNAELLFQLGEWCSRATHARFVYLWGEPGCGKSHLLRAATLRAGAPLYDATTGLPDEIDGPQMLAVDNVHALDRAGQETLFAHYNTLRDGGGSLLASGLMPPMLLPLLPDLASRLSWGLTYQLKPLSDPDKAAALATRARLLGFELGTEQTDYLLRHAPRDLMSLYQILDIANDWALSRRKAVTLGLLREILQGMASSHLASE